MKAFKVKRGRESYFRIQLPKQLCPDGRRRSVMGKTKAEAVKKYDEELARWQHGLDQVAGDKTVQEFLTMFLAYYERDGGVASSTLQDYRYHIDSHIAPLLGKVALKSLAPRNVDEFLKALKEKGLARERHSTPTWSFVVPCNSPLTGSTSRPTRLRRV